MCNEEASVRDGQGRDPGPVRLVRDLRGDLVFRTDPQAEPIAGVRVVRCFPWSLPDRYISILDKDGNELFLFRTLDEAEPETRRLIEEELQKQEFVPRITAILSVDDQFDVLAWKVQTDRGPVELQIKSTEDIRRLDEKRVLIKDHAGGLFEVPDITQLDARSRRFIEDYVA